MSAHSPSCESTAPLSMQASFAGTTAIAVSATARDAAYRTAKETSDSTAKRAAQQRFSLDSTRATPAAAAPTEVLWHAALAWQRRFHPLCRRRPRHHCRHRHHPPRQRAPCGLRSSLWSPRAVAPSCCWSARHPAGATGVADASRRRKTRHEPLGGCRTCNAPTFPARCRCRRACRRRRRETETLRDSWHPPRTYTSCAVKKASLVPVVVVIHYSRQKGNR